MLDGLRKFIVTNNAAAVGGAFAGLVAALAAAATVPNDAGEYVAASGAVALTGGAVLTVLVHRRDLPSDRALDLLAKVMTVAGALMAMFAALQLLGLQSREALPWAAAPVVILLVVSVVIALTTRRKDEAAVAATEKINAEGDLSTDDALRQAEDAVETAGKAKADAEEALRIARELEKKAQRELPLTEALAATISALIRELTPRRR